MQVGITCHGDPDKCTSVTGVSEMQKEQMQEMYYIYEWRANVSAEREK